MIKKIINFYKNLSKRERWILYVTGLIMMIFMTDRVVIGPVVKKLITLDEETYQRENAVKKSLHILLRKDQIIADGKKIMSYSIASDDLEMEMTDFLKELENIAQRSHVNLKFVRPGATSNEQGMIRQSANLECEAEMPEIVTFMHTIESSSRLLRIVKFDIQPKDKNSNIARCVMMISRTAFPQPKI